MMNVGRIEQTSSSSANVSKARAARKSHASAAENREARLRAARQRSPYAAALLIMQEFDVQNISPREMKALSEKLHDAGIINHKEHGMLSFQPELSPQFEARTGPITRKTKRKAGISSQHMIPQPFTKF